MKITADLVKQLRERTGAGMMECKKALVEREGDIDAAAELLRKRGAAKADKKAGRVAAEGVIALARSDDGRRAALLEVNCETDFVAGNEAFIGYADALAAAALATRGDGDTGVLMDSEVADGKTGEELRRELIAKLGENINVRRYAHIDSGEHLGAYLHGRRIGAVVATRGGDADLAYDLAMHVAASKPLCVAAEDVPPDTLDKEREILSAQASQEGKPEHIVAKMVEGRLRKYLAEVTLLGQPFVKDPDVTVQTLVAKAQAEVTGFLRFEVGEGIEKKAQNFAAEVMSQVKGE